MAGARWSRRRVSKWAAVALLALVVWEYFATRPLGAEEAVHLLGGAAVPSPYVDRVVHTTSHWKYTLAWRGKSLGGPFSYTFDLAREPISARAWVRAAILRQSDRWQGPFLRDRDCWMRLDAPADAGEARRILLDLGYVLESGSAEEPSVRFVSPEGAFQVRLSRPSAAATAFWVRRYGFEPAHDVWLGIAHLDEQSAAGALAATTMRVFLERSRNGVVVCEHEMLARRTDGVTYRNRAMRDWRAMFGPDAIDADLAPPD